MNRVILSIFATVLLLTPVCSRADVLRLYTVGNSLTDEVAHRDFETTVESRPGRQLVWGKHMTSGAPLEWNWTHPTAGSAFNGQAGSSTGYADALDDFAWDVVTLQPYDRQLGDDYRHVARFVHFLAQKPENANTRLYIYSQWPRKREGAAFNYRAWWDRPYDGGWNGTAGAPDPTFRTRDYYQDLVRLLRNPANTEGVPANQWPLQLSQGDAFLNAPDGHPNSLLNKQINLIPVGDVMYRLDEMLSAVPDAKATYGIAGAADLYSDEQHLNAFGKFVVAMTWYATLYAEDPTGLPLAAYADNDPGILLNPAFASLVQRTTWEVVNGHPYSGVNVPEPAAIAPGCGLALTLLRRPRRPAGKE